MTEAAPDPLSRAFAALADPTRRAILTMLTEDDMAVTDVAGPFAMSLAAVSKHLKVLADAGLIRQERRGRVTWCKLDPDALRPVAVWVQGLGLLDPLDLDALERFLEAELADAGAAPLDASRGAEPGAVPRPAGQGMGEGGAVAAEGAAAQRGAAG